MDGVRAPNHAHSIHLTIVVCYIRDWITIQLIRKFVVFDDRQILVWNISYATMVHVTS